MYPLYTLDTSGGSTVGSEARRRSHACAEQRRNRIRVDGFREVMVEAGRGGALLVLGTSPAGNGDEHDLRASIQRPQARAELVTIHPRHSQIDEGDVRVKPFCNTKTFNTIVRCLHL